MKAFAILGGLQSCLDFERGGEIAPQVDAFYNHAMTRMLHFNQKNDPGICDELVAFLSPMRASWAVIAEGAAPEPSARGPDQPPARPASFVT
jgi:flagellar protein FliS